MDELTGLLEENKESDIYPFHMPGHKRMILSDEGDLLSQIRGLDITEIDGFDNLHNPEGVIFRLEEKISELWKSYESHILVGGSTSGILIAINACAKRGRRFLIARNSHKSVYNALMICGSEAEYIFPEYIDSFEINGIINPKEVECKLKENSDINVVVITSPTYEGIISDIQGIADIVHKNNGWLIVDEAHGSHLTFSGIKSAVECGADFVIQSIHKTLPAFTQTAIIHISERAIKELPVKKYLYAFQSTSPSYLLMASVSRCVDILARKKEQLFCLYEKRLQNFYEKVEELKNLHVVNEKDVSNQIYGFDKGKLIIYAGNSNITGKWLYYELLNKYKLQLEMYSGNYCLAMTSIMDTDKGLERLVTALASIDKEIDVGKTERFNFNNNNHIEIKYKISDAIRKSNTLIELENAKGRICADYVYIYPPGIPILAPGELISEEIINKIWSIQGLDNRIYGLDNGKLLICNE